MHGETMKFINNETRQCVNQQLGHISHACPQVIALITQHKIP
jgi:hypothetical protein